MGARPRSSGSRSTSRPPGTASACRRTTRCTRGSGSTTRAASSRCGTLTCAAPRRELPGLGARAAARDGRPARAARPALVATVGSSDAGPSDGVGFRLVRRGRFLQLFLYAVAAAVITTAVAVLVPWMPVDASKQGERIDFTYWFMTGIAIFVFAVVAAILVYAVINFRA